ncbi:hypothetical protein [Pantoea ananatis]|uniref:hypothetical protein n=1 Tax=Pantoea ananas TaxID=553 RepID=UPI001B302274|nr:hypothetical protein [Pantoea ananatis]
MNLDTLYSSAFLTSCSLPFIYIVYMLVLALYSRNLNKRSVKGLFHICSKRNGKKIHSKGYFFSRTEGLVFCSSNPKSQNLGEDAISLKKFTRWLKFHSNYRKAKNNRSKKSIFLFENKKKRRLRELFKNYNIMPIVFIGDSVKLFKPVFSADVFFLFRFWQSIKMFTCQWTTIKQGDIKIINSRILAGKLFIRKANIVDKTGCALVVAKILKYGMILLNLFFFIAAFSFPLCFLFNLSEDTLFSIIKPIVLTLLMTIIIWRVISKKVHNCAERK